VIPPDHPAERLQAEVIRPLKRRFVGRDEVIDLIALAIASGEHLFLHGPPGTAKSALIRAFAGSFRARYFEAMLTKFSEPNELFGPVDLVKLREGRVVTVIDGMLPDAEVAFLDELFNANSAILNNLLTILNERIYRRGLESQPGPPALPLHRLQRGGRGRGAPGALRPLPDPLPRRATPEGAADRPLRGRLGPGRAGRPFVVPDRRRPPRPGPDGSRGRPRRRDGAACRVGHAGPRPGGRALGPSRGQAPEADRGLCGALRADPGHRGRPLADPLLLGPPRADRGPRLAGRRDAARHRRGARPSATRWRRRGPRRTARRSPASWTRPRPPLSMACRR
jgi:energy-coupling factor transporter ATP-binding protein EcfA2